MKFKKIVLTTLIFTFFIPIFLTAQNELKTTTMKLGHLWLGIKANGDRGNFFYQSSFFPNDFGVLGLRGQYVEAYTGVSTLATTYWKDPADSIRRVAIFNFTDEDFLPIGKVTSPLTNNLRYKFTDFSADGNTINYPLFGTHNPEYPEFQNHTFDEIVEVTNMTVLGVEVKRKILVWTQNFNNDYVITDIEYTNTSNIPLDTFYINLQQSSGNAFFSNVDANLINPAVTWKHYYGARPGDSMRVFYEYSADDAQLAGDNMGLPVSSGTQRLLFPNMVYYSVLHASAEPYNDPANDRDSSLLPSITYIGKDNRIPFNQGSDEYGSKNFYAIRGGFADDYPMDGKITGTHHGYNNDELGIADYSNHTSGEFGSISYKFCSFGPYKFLPGQKIHIVIASGYTGIGYEKGQEVAKKWANGSLENPPNMPNAETGWLPQQFKFPDGATEMDKRKDKWISMGIDSVMQSAWRAKWNYDHNYNIPKAPPPPDNVSIIGYGDGVEIKWSDPSAETLPNFSGYRIMRRITNSDTVFYKQIYSSDLNDKAAEHIFKDTTAIPSTNTFYYVQAKAIIDESDPNYLNADPSTRNKIMYSSRTLIPNNDTKLSVNPPRFPQDDLSKIRVVPNPFNISDPSIRGRFSKELGDQVITFYNLPVSCTIKIFTENGDLIQTIEHNNPVTRSGSEQWDMTTSSQQAINSGVYVAVFQKPSGELSYQKFVVVR